MKKTKYIVASIVKRNMQENNDAWEIVAKLSEDLFDENEAQHIHNPYNQEEREMESIMRGDEEGLRKSLDEVYTGKIGTLAKDPLRHHKNVAIGNITLASRAAIRGGVNEEKAFAMADSLIQQVEELTSIPEVLGLIRQSKFLYLYAVQEEKRTRKKNQNPLVIGAKNYIYSHLHDAIRAADIAEVLAVNADYLSHLFKKEEGISIKQYALEEKVRRSQNLLKYSDYRIQDIGFYLGFCSQSHFAKVFQKYNGMTPTEYRIKYGRENNFI